MWRDLYGTLCVISFLYHNDDSFIYSSRTISKLSSSFESRAYKSYCLRAFLFAGHWVRGFLFYITYCRREPYTSYKAKDIFLSTEVKRTQYVPGNLESCYRHFGLFQLERTEIHDRPPRGWMATWRTKILCTFQLQIWKLSRPLDCRYFSKKKPPYSFHSKMHFQLRSSTTVAIRVWS